MRAFHTYEISYKYREPKINYYFTENFTEKYHKFLVKTDVD